MRLLFYYGTGCIRLEYILMFERLEWIRMDYILMFERFGLVVDLCGIIL